MEAVRVPNPKKPAQVETMMKAQEISEEPT
jgi:hypothetical protein